MFNKILIANRGEIACRVIQTARRLGIATVTVYSSADNQAQHVQLADEAYCIGPAAVQQSYLNTEKIIDVALKSQAQAIHPGYGFLSENGLFAELCEQAGIVFIGPPPEAIYAMGSKSAAKRIMEKAKVPLLPGYHGQEQDLATLSQAAAKIGYPVMLKAAAGGGGKGMRIIHTDAEFEHAFTSAKREAKASFGDDSMLLEKYLAAPRHIEIQVFADQHGNAVYLFERDCSIQRRHQKLLEEAPAPHIPTDLRDRMGQAAISAAKTINYCGAGTVEFLVDEKFNFYFMEMNTRLQVEHPVTEMITQQDLVEWQLEVASGQTLPLAQEDLSIHGHAMEVRLYAEDPANDFLPATGQIAYLHWPESNKQVRIDSGIAQGDTISQYYDPMLAKLIVWGKDRQSCVRQLRQALAQLHLVGLSTNIQFLRQLSANADFYAGKVSTAFIPQHQQELFPAQPEIPPAILASAALFVLLQQQATVRGHALASQDPHSPWHSTDGWRLNRTAQQTLRFKHQDSVVSINAQYQYDAYLLEFNEQTLKIKGALNGEQLSVAFADQQLQLTVIQHANTLYVFVENSLTENNSYQLEHYDPATIYDQEEEASGSLAAPMPGTVVAMLTQVGKKVARGDQLLVIEAMKMEHTIQAPLPGTIKEIHYNVGDMVNEGVELLTLETE